MSWNDLKRATRLARIRAARRASDKGPRAATGHRLGAWHQNAKHDDETIRVARDIHKCGAAGYRLLGRLFDCSESTARDWITFRTRANA
jgi:hypothetical protein